MLEKDKYCVTGPDGKLYCIDPKDNKLYVFERRVITPQQVGCEVLNELLKKVISDQATN